MAALTLEEYLKREYNRGTAEFLLKISGVNEDGKLIVVLMAKERGQAIYRGQWLVDGDGVQGQ